MNSPTPLLNSQRTTLLLVLVVLFASLYMLTYSGRVESGDSLSLMDAAGSLVQFGDVYLDLSMWFNPPRAFALQEQSYPLQRPDVEPPPLYLTASLFWLAENIPGIGLVHTVWLLNMLISAVAVGVLFVYALELGYGERTAVFGAVLFGGATILWPYSKSLFRDPILLLMILLTALFLERWRAGEYRSFLLLAMAVVAFVVAVYTKEAAAFALPTLLVIALRDTPPRFQSRHWRRGGVLLLVGIVVTLLFIAYAPRRDILIRLSISLSRADRFVLVYLQNAIHAYLFSIGGSIWGTSPIVLLALPGGWLLWKRNERRYVWAVVFIVVAFALGHAALRGPHWFGGLSWPPRFLVPVVPFLIIAALPVLDRIAQKTAAAWVVIGAGLLIIYSVWVQISGVSLWWGEYAGALPPESGQLLEWWNGLNEPRYLRWVVIPSLWASHPLDFAWVRVGTPLWPLMFGLLAAASVAAWWYVLRGGRQLRFIAATVPIAWLVFTWLALRMIAPDEMYAGTNSALHATLPIMEAETDTGSVVLLASNRYERFFLNYGKHLNARIITLPPQPGEQSGPEQPPQVVSDNIDALLTNLTVPLIHVLASQRDRLWLLADSGPFIPWAVRPVERFMTAHYFPIREIATDPEVRLIEYSTVRAHDPFAFRGPDELTNLMYSDAMQLVGYTLPEGTTYAPEQALPVSLYWQAAAPIEQDYTVAWFLADEAGAMVAQGMDSYPAGGFERTSQWQVGVPVWDNRALWLPADLAAGDYVLWIKVYTFDATGAIQDLTVTGATVVNDTIGVLPTSIEIRS